LGVVEAEDEMGRKAGKEEEDASRMDQHRGAKEDETRSAY